MKRWTRLAIWLIPALAFVHACGGNAATDSTSGNTNWLKLCDKQADCGEGLSCQCNVCQETCTTSADCTLAAPGSRCAAPSEEMQCESAPAGIRLCVKNCDVSTDCERDGLICVASACVLRTGSDALDAATDVAADGADPGQQNSDATPLDSVDPDASFGPGDSGQPNNGPLISGEGYAVAYAFPEVWNARSDCSATFDANGNMTAFNFSPSEYFVMGNASFQGADSDGPVAWGEWVGGPIEGVLGGDDFSNTFPGITAGFHYAVGRGVPTTLPGESIYDHVGHTGPSDPNAANASLDDLVIAINFETGRVGAESTVSTIYGSETFATSEGVTDLSAAEGVLGSGYLFDINLENHASFGELRGAVVGDAATDLVVSYRFVISSYDDGGPAPSLELYGTAVLRRPLSPQ